jgi:hypothetical protein
LGELAAFLSIFSKKMTTCPIPFAGPCMADLVQDLSIEMYRFNFNACIPFASETNKFRPI